MPRGTAACAKTLKLEKAWQVGSWEPRRAELCFVKSLDFIVSIMGSHGSILMRPVKFLIYVFKE